MADLPWWTLSPSPWSVVMYVAMFIYAAVKIGKVKVDRPFYLRLTDGFFVVGLAVLPTDAAWVLASALRWAPYFPAKDVWQLTICFGRDLAGMALCGLFVYWLFKNGVLRLTKWPFLAYLVNAIYISVWFTLAPVPAYTDWTYAIRHGYPLAVVVLSFVLSHVIGRVIFMPIFLTLFNRQIFAQPR